MTPKSSTTSSANQAAVLAARGLGTTSAGFIGLAPPKEGPPTRKKELPLYAVRWQQATAQLKPEPKADAKAQPKMLKAATGVPFLVKLTSEPLKEGEVAEVVQAAQRSLQLVIACLPTQGIFEQYEEELQLAWHFVHLVQRLLEAGVSAKLLVVTAAASTGAMVAGASKAVAMEASELKIQRIFVPRSCLQAISEHVERLCSASELYSHETDIWLRHEMSRTAYVPRLERCLSSGRKRSFICCHLACKELASYVLTGATGGLGKAVVSWLVNDQGLQPSQLVLLRRAGSSKLDDDLAKCTVVEAAAVDSKDSLKLALEKVRHVTGVFHLAGVLDDGIIGGMTEQRMKKVAQPKCGMLLALLKGDSTSCRIISVNWGPWGEAGMAQEGTKAYEQAVKEGDTPLSTRTALACLFVAVCQAMEVQGVSQLCACDVQWEKSQWKENEPTGDHLGLA
eukprot:g40.t1